MSNTVAMRRSTSLMIIYVQSVTKRRTPQYNVIVENFNAAVEKGSLEKIHSVIMT